MLIFLYKLFFLSVKNGQTVEEEDSIMLKFAFFKTQEICDRVCEKEHNFL